MNGSKFNDTEVNSHIVLIDRALSEKFRTINKERLDNYNMTVSRLQWSEADKAILEEQGRPANSYNLISPILKAVAGMERSGRKKIQIVGRTADDQPSAQLMTEVLDWAYSLSKYDLQKSKAVLDALIGRWGVIYTGFSYDDDPQGLLTVKRVNPFRLKFDMDFSDISMSDCRFLLDSAWYTTEEILQMYALDDSDMWEEIVEKSKTFFSSGEESKPKGIVATFLSRIWGATGVRNSTNNISVRPDMIDWFDPTSGRFKVLELHERRLAKKMHIFDPIANQKYDITDMVKPDSPNSLGYDNDKLQLIRQKFADPRVSQVTQKEIWITTSVPAFDMKLQDVPYDIQNGNFKYSFVYAYDFHADIMNCQSLVDELIDPQSSYNKRRSTMLEYVTRFSAQGYIVEEGAIDGYEDEWKNKRIGGIRTIKAGKMDRWKVDAPAIMPPALTQLEQEEEALIEKISGISRANKGQQEAANETGKLFLAKKQQGEIMMQYFFDNIEFTMMQVARNAIDNIQYYMTEQRIIRVSADFGNPKYLTINQKTVEGIKNNITNSKFDLEISSMPYGSTAREVEFVKLMDMFNFIVTANPQLATGLLPVILEASDSPYRNKLIEAINTILGQQQQAADAQAQQMQKVQDVELAKKQAEIGKDQIEQQQFIEDLKAKRNDNYIDELLKSGINSILN